MLFYNTASAKELYTTPHGWDRVVLLKAKDRKVQSCSNPHMAGLWKPVECGYVEKSVDKMRKHLQKKLEKRGLWINMPRVG